MFGVSANQLRTAEGTPQVKASKTQTHSKVHRIPSLHFSAQRRLTSYAGLVVFQALLQKLELKSRLRCCFRHLPGNPIVGLPAVFVLLIVHLLLGFRRLRGMDVYRHDPLVTRVVGLRQLPDVSTVSRALAHADSTSVMAVRQLLGDEVCARLAKERFPRVTLDFDGSVQSTTGHIEGTAVGYNRENQGDRSYYPLFCTIAQTGQFLDMHHRSGNVHDSNGALGFMRDCINRVRTATPKSWLEARVDSAFFDIELLDALDKQEVHFSCSVPFERFPRLKGIITNCQQWKTINARWSYYELDWKPKSWPEKYRFVALRQLHRKPRKGPVQLDLFEPVDLDYQYTVVVTNRQVKADTLRLFHHGRGEQEKLIGQCKQHVALGVIPTHRVYGNQLFTLAGMYAHNLGHELQMQSAPRHGKTHRNRTAQWDFQELGTLGQRVVHQAGHLTRPQGELTLTLNDIPQVRREIVRYMSGVAAP